MGKQYQSFAKLASSATRCVRQLSQKVVVKDEKDPVEIYQPMTAAAIIGIWTEDRLANPSCQKLIPPALIFDDLALTWEHIDSEARALSQVMALLGHQHGFYFTGYERQKEVRIESGQFEYLPAMVGKADFIDPDGHIIEIKTGRGFQQSWKVQTAGYILASGKEYGHLMWALRSKNRIPEAGILKISREEALGIANLGFNMPQHRPGSDCEKCFNDACPFNSQYIQQH